MWDCSLFFCFKSYEFSSLPKYSQEKYARNIKTHTHTQTVPARNENVIGSYFPSEKIINQLNQKKKKKNAFVFFNNHLSLKIKRGLSPQNKKNLSIGQVWSSRQVPIDLGDLFFLNIFFTHTQKKSIRKNVFIYLFPLGRERPRGEGGGGIASKQKNNGLPHVLFFFLFFFFVQTKVSIF